MDKKIAIHTMELWLANLPVTPGHVQHGTRPVVIVSNDVANNFSPIVTAVPLTSNRKAATLPTHVCLCGYGLAATSIAKCEQVMALDKSCLIRRLGEVSDGRHQQERGRLLHRRAAVPRQQSGEAKPHRTAVSHR